MFQGVFYAALAGILISLQNVFMARTGEKIGFWETSTAVHGLGFLAGVLILLMVGRSQGSSFKDVNYLYLGGCAIGIFIVFSVVQGVTRLGVVFAVPVLIGAQVVFSVLINRLGLFEEKIVIPSVINLLGILLLIIGVVLSQIR